MQHFSLGSTNHVQDLSLDHLTETYPNQRKKTKNVELIGSQADHKLLSISDPVLFAVALSATVIMKLQDDAFFPSALTL